MHWPRSPRSYGLALGPQRLMPFALNNGAIEVTIYINDRPFLWYNYRIIRMALGVYLAPTVSASKFVQLSIDRRLHHSVVVLSNGRLSMRRINAQLGLYLTFDIHSLSVPALH